MNAHHNCTLFLMSKTSDKVRLFVNKANWTRTRSHSTWPSFINNKWENISDSYLYIFIINIYIDYFYHWNYSLYWFADDLEIIKTTHQVTNRDKKNFSMAEIRFILTRKIRNDIQMNPLTRTFCLLREVLAVDWQRHPHSHHHRQQQLYKASDSNE